MDSCATQRRLDLSDSQREPLRPEQRQTLQGALDEHPLSE